MNATVLDRFDQHLVELLNTHRTIKSREETREAVRKLVSDYTGTIFQEGREGFREIWQHWDPDPRYQVGLYVHDSIAGLPEETAEAAESVLVTLANVSITPTRKRLFASKFDELRKAAEDYLELRGIKGLDDACPPDDLLDKLTWQQRTIVECLWKTRHSVGFDRLPVGCFRRTPKDDGTIVTALKRTKRRLGELFDVFEVDLEISEKGRRVKLVR